VTFQSRVY